LIDHGVGKVAGILLQKKQYFYFSLLLSQTSIIVSKITELSRPD
jgi:hypothetical protein